MVYVNKQGGLRSHPLCLEAISLWNWCIRLHLSTGCVPSGIQNSLADKLSRSFLADHELEVCDNVLSEIFTQWGTLQCDLFVPQTDRKLPLYCSSGAIGRSSPGDTILLTWMNDLMYYLSSHTPASTGHREGTS